MPWYRLVIMELWSKKLEETGMGRGVVPKWAGSVGRALYPTAHAQLDNVWPSICPPLIIPTYSSRFYVMYLVRVRRQIRQGQHNLVP